MNSENDYDKTPVEGFGKLMIARMGWYQGRGIGKSSSGEIQIHLNSIGRNERNGLGSDKQLIKEKKSEFEIGKIVTICKGKHKGVTGIVLQVYDEIAVIEITNNKNHLHIPLLSLKLGTMEQAKALDNQPRQLRWVIPGLKVRVKNKYIHGGSLYNCKAIIDDVIDSYRFIVRIGSKMFDDLCEKDVETILPRVGSNVIIVKRQYKGEISKLLARDKKRNRATVQVSGHQTIELSQNDVSDFIQE